MKKWLAFLITPALLIIALETICAAVLGGVFRLNTSSFISLTVIFCVYFIGGVTIFHMAPNKDPRHAYTLAAIYAIGAIYLGLSTDGNELKLMGERSVMHFKIFPEIIKAAGLLIGIWGAKEGEAQNNKT